MRFIVRTFFYVGIFCAGTVIFVVGFFLFDASTYRETPMIEAVPISSLALTPRRGGPKNLPIVEHFVDDDDSDKKKTSKHKPKMVILGTGWGAVSLLKNLKPEDYHVTVISPSNQFLFTPMLPSATVGTLELRSLVEPVRKIVTRVHGHFLKAMAVDVAFSEKLVEVQAVDTATGEKQSFYVPYDKLVIACGMIFDLSIYRSRANNCLLGSITNPHGVPGLENCHFLKDIHDARAIRNTVIRNLENACLPTTTDEERRRLLSFVVCGGGPTGVEFAAELYDMLNEDLVNVFPKILRCEISVHLVQSRGHILNTYDEALSKFAEVRINAI
jgi:NADH:ubiquinone reductase (H+-translocating)